MQDSCLLLRDLPLAVTVATLGIIHIQYTYIHMCMYICKCMQHIRIYI